MEQLQSIHGEVKELFKQRHVSFPNAIQLRREAEKFATLTEFENLNFGTNVKNRSAGVAVIIGKPEIMDKSPSQRQKEIIANAPATLAKVRDYIGKAPFVCVERRLGSNRYFAPKCTLYLSVYRKECIRLAYMFSELLFEPTEAKGTNLYMVYIPEWQEKDRQVIFFPEEGTVYVLGTDYFGEVKKGFMRLAMHYAKKEGMLGLHAGTKVIYAKDKEGKINKHGVIIFGATATGKTTHTCHGHGLNEEGEFMEILQDDYCFWREDGSTLGGEKGFYIKTDGADPVHQKLIYDAATQEHAILENVFVDYQGKVNFQDEILTGNGRAIIQREDLGKHKSPDINLPPVEELNSLIFLFITRRNTVVPIASKLSIEQAATVFMLGESIETTGSDPRRAGESKREPGTNSWIIGDPAVEGNIFYKFLKKHADKIQCYLLNTGGVGEIMEDENGIKVVKQKVLRVEIPEMAGIIRGIARNTIIWEKEPYFNTLVPIQAEGVDMKKFELKNFYSEEQIDAYVNALKKERIEYMKKFSELNLDIVKAVEY